ncbi:flagellar basal-body MS-ring/collar protein FliF [Glaciibacter psychrotolerans]|uniref:Flagellar M-ring protein n=1 Tax=Glaciibacter psychrotolerans TaxID=670054 RepID=A0A7Z0J5C3_9MICO|nr:flagellar M-ring protein FliF [Leifsonia psychrotolerans]
MQRTLTSFFSRAKGVAGGFSAAQRTVTIIGVAVLVLGAIALGTWITRPTLTPLFSGLSAADASTIVEQLRSSNVQFELTNGGSTILVPEAEVYNQRLAAAASGMPSSSTGGYALLDTMGVTTSEFQQSVTYKRALEGELAATIGAMKGVKLASVKLAIPEETVFVVSKLDPTASVFVETQNGVTLSTDQVTAIVHLTSASIEGMKATDVAVIDSNGTVLSAVGTGATGSSDKQTSAYEGRVQSAVQVMLDRIVGSGNSTVAVSATISAESAEVITETFTQSPEVSPLSESKNTETYTGTGNGTATGGVLGPDNIAVPNGGSGDGTYNSEATVRDNAVNKVSESRTVPAGAVARQTVSVAINKDASPSVSNAEIAALVTAAAGIDAKRGDAVTVKTVAFNASAAAGATQALAAAEQAAAADRTAGLIRTGMIVLGILTPIILALVLFMRRSKEERTPVELDDVPLLTEVLPAVPQRAIEVQPPPVLMPEPEPNSMDLNRRSISQLASQNPEKTAALLRGLMDERQGA